MRSKLSGPGSGHHVSFEIMCQNSKSILFFCIFYGKVIERHLSYPYVRHMFPRRCIYNNAQIYTYVYLWLKTINPTKQTFAERCKTKLKFPEPHQFIFDIYHHDSIKWISKKWLFKYLHVKKVSKLLTFSLNCRREYIIFLCCECANGPWGIFFSVYSTII